MRLAALTAFLVAALALPSAATPIRVLAIGDSITWGWVSAPTGPGYVDLLASELGADYEVTNIGCGGSTTAMWLPSAGAITCGGRFYNRRVDYWARLVDRATPADLATIMLGTVDAARGILPWVYGDNLQQIIAGLFDRGVGEIVLMTQPTRPNADAATRALLDAYAAAVGGLCATLPGVRCGPDVYRLLDPVADFALGDIHPNRTGHVKIASALGGYIVNPEPSTGALVLLGLVVLGCRRHRGRPS